MKLPIIHSPEDIAELVQKIGFVPFFRNPIPGFSIEECTPAELWFSATQDGPWEWKGPVARRSDCFYGKFFRGRAAFISAELFPAYANWRRDGYDFDSRCEEGIAPYREEQIYSALRPRGSLLSTELRKICGPEGTDKALTALQMQTYVCISDFEYRIDKSGRRTGWGIARYAAPEDKLSPELVRSAYSEEPRDSARRFVEAVGSALPGVGADALEKLLR